jgi:hypothetical protein
VARAAGCVEREHIGAELGAPASGEADASNQRMCQKSMSRQVRAILPQGELLARHQNGTGLASVAKWT